MIQSYSTFPSIFNRNPRRKTLKTAFHNDPQTRNDLKQDTWSHNLDFGEI